MGNTMKVRSADGLRCPKEGKPKEYVTADASGEDVSATTYYRRLVGDGSLVLVTEEAAAKPSRKADAATADQKPEGGAA